MDKIFNWEVWAQRRVTGTRSLYEKKEKPEANWWEFCLDVYVSPLSILNENTQELLKWESLLDVGSLHGYSVDEWHPG